jgi:hypothetical protein
MVTAVLINLPIMGLLFFQAIREQWVSGTKAIAYALLVPLTIGLAISALIAVPSEYFAPSTAGAETCNPVPRG